MGLNRGLVLSVTTLAVSMVVLLPVVDGRVTGGRVTGGRVTGGLIPSPCMSGNRRSSRSNGNEKQTTCVLLPA